VSPTGLTKDAGWQIGVSRTLQIDLALAWDFLVSPTGLALWLGEVEAPLVKGSEYRTRDGTTGEVRGLRPQARLRLPTSPKAASNPPLCKSPPPPPRAGPWCASTPTAWSAAMNANASANAGARRWIGSKPS